MSYRPIRKDLIDGKQKCHFCSHPLSSLKAYILENTETKEIVNAGSKCAKDNIDSQYKLELIPDFTRYTLAMNERESDIVKSGQNSERTDNSTIEEINHKKAIEYIELREIKLSKDFNTSYPILKNYYHKYLNSKLENSEIDHILNIERKAPEDLKLVNLQKCYNYIFWIDVAIGKLKDKPDEFFKGVRSYLVRNRRITNIQKVALNNWIANLSDVPKLK